MASISGVTRINGNIESCTVRLYDRVTGDLISEVTSNSLTGEYRFPNLSPSTEFDVVCIGSVEVCPQISGPLSPIVTIDEDYYDAVIASGPTAYWRMDDIDSTLHDEFGLYNGTYSGTPLYNQPPLINGGASVKMNGSPDLAIVPDNENLRPGIGEYAIELWMNWTSTNIGVVFDKARTVSPYNGITVILNYNNGALNVGRIGFRDSEPLAYAVSSIDGGMNDGTSRHFVFQRRKISESPDVYELQIYINGVLNNSKVLSSIINHDMTPNIQLFGRSTFPNNYINGNFDEVAYYVGKSLTPSEILAHYQAALF